MDDQSSQDCPFSGWEHCRENDPQETWSAWERNHSLLDKTLKKRLLKTSEMLLVWLAGPSLYTSSTSSKMKWLQRISQVFSQKTPLLTRILAGFIRKAKTFTNSWCFCSEIFKEAENSDKQIKIEKLIMVICCIATTCLQLNFWILSK